MQSIATEEKDIAAIVQHACQLCKELADPNSLATLPLETATALNTGRMALTDTILRYRSDRASILSVVESCHRFMESLDGADLTIHSVRLTMIRLTGAIAVYTQRL